MPQARLKFKPSRLAGPFKFATEHPDCDLRILSAFPTEKGLLVILEARMEDPVPLDHLFDGTDIAPSYEVLHDDEQRVLLQYELPFVPPPYRALFASENLPQFPYIIRDGWTICELTTTHERLSQFKDELESTGFTCEVVSLVQSTDPTDLLTERQQQLITTAIERGYYETPRGCSLTDIAAALNISKSTASEIRHRAESKIVTEFITNVLTTASDRNTNF
jgi:predicted DNA binding protein